MRAQQHSGQQRAAPARARMSRAGNSLQNFLRTSRQVRLLLNSGHVLDHLYHPIPVHRLRPHSISPAYRRRFPPGPAQFYPSALGSLLFPSLVSSGSVLISFLLLRHVRGRSSWIGERKASVNESIKSGEYHKLTPAQL